MEENIKIITEREFFAAKDAKDANFKKVFSLRYLRPSRQICFFVGI